jgi:predicted nucleic acid-binding protein
MTSRRLVYVDASAIVKLVITEAESAALEAFVRADRRLISSRVAAIEVRRAAERQQEQPTAQTVDAVIASLGLIDLYPALADVAGRLPPPTLRSLDAIHLATALSLGDELDALVTYDGRLADAARAAGLEVVAPA